MLQAEGSGGSASQSNGSFAVDLTTRIFQNPANQATLDTSLTVAVPTTTSQMPYGWYTLREGTNGIYSEARMIQVGPAKPVTSPVLNGTAQGTSSVSWTWAALAGVDGYNVYNATTGIFVTTIPATGSPRFDQTGLQSAATAAILVAGYTLTGDGPLAASPTTYTDPARPLAVTVASVTFSDLLLYWNPSTNSDEGTTYEVTQSSDNFVTDVSTPVPQIFNLMANFTTISNLIANTTYYFRVRAFNINSVSSPYSASVSTRTRAGVSQPIIVSRQTSVIDWAWTDPGGVTNYRVYNATDNALLASPVLPSFSEVGLGTNTIHSIRVSAVTNAGEGPLSTSASAYTNAATPGVFVPPITALSTTSFQLNWTNNNNPLLTPYAGSVIEYNSDGTVRQSTSFYSTAFSATFGGFDPGAFVTYDITAVNGDGINSDTPPVIAGSTWTIPTSPSPLSIVGSLPTSIIVAWTANSNTSSTTYQVTYSTDNFVLNIATAVAFSAKFTGLSYTIPNLITGSTYGIRVIASNPFGQQSAFSNTITTRTFNGGGPLGSLQGTASANADSSIAGSLGNGRQISLRIPARTFPSDVVITISSFVPAGTLCPNATNIAFSIVDQPALQPIGSLFLSFQYLNSELGTIPANRALLLRYDAGSGTCVPLETTVDTANNLMTARINHFSLFQVGQVPLAATPETARVFPNPYYVARDGFVTIDNIPPSARVRIFTLRGEQVLDVAANGSGLLTWSGNNGSGRPVASGVYLVMIESGSSKKIVKVAVIR